MPMPRTGCAMRAIETLRRWIPRWWRGERGAAGRVLHAALAPAEAGFSAAARIRNTAYDAGLLRSAEAPIAVISVGNIGVGGAGKTPVAAWLARRLADSGRRPALVLRGYGADEVAVHRELNPAVPVYAAPKRIDGVRAAFGDRRDVAVLDDAFQHRALARDADIVLVSAESWGTQRHLLPRGPWREPPAALARADLVIVTRKSASREAAAAVAAECRADAPAVPVAIVHLAPAGLSAGADERVGEEWLHDRAVLAVASLADPQPFVRQLQELGARVELADYPDHHPFTAADVGAIARRASGRPMVCTRKEAVKLRPLLALYEGAAPSLVVLEQGVVVESGGEAIDRILASLPHPPAEGGTEFASIRATNRSNREAGG